MKQFTNLGLAEPLLRAVSAEGYTQPTPIQADVIPAMGAGRDILGIAQTGTGKTAAFVLPILDRIARDRPKVMPKSCGALILAPTRELAAQIEESIRTHGKFLKPTSAVIVGGVKPGPQIRAMARGVDLLVATPGRLLDHLSTGAVRLDGTWALVLDEADQMLDLGFLPAIRRIVAKLPKARQTALLSATMPKEIRKLAQDMLRDPLEVSVAPASRPIERIDQKVLHVEKAEKRSVLTGLLKETEVDRAIVFTRTKRGADRVNQHLQRAGLQAAAIHGDKSQGQRQRALGDFKAGRVTILVATDIAARGIDIDDVSHVFNFELPNVPEAYVHRIGRTARAGRSGTAVSLCDASETDLLRDIEKLIGQGFGRPAGARSESPRPAGAGRGRPKGKGAAAGGRASDRKPSRKAAPRKKQGGPRPAKAPADRAADRGPATEAPDQGLSRMLSNIGA